MKIPADVKKNRKPNYEISPLIVSRWSPRSLTGDEISDDDLMALFEAARWAPSSFNAQPWRFIYAKRDTKEWGTFLDLLMEGNRAWAKDAAVLVVVASRKNFEYKERPSITHQFDAGAAWQNLALEATRRNLVAHGMEGFDYKKAQKVTKLPDVYDVLAMIAIGKRGKIEKLPEQMQKMEQPNQRRPLKEIAMKGKFTGKK